MPWVLQFPFIDCTVEAHSFSPNLKIPLHRARDSSPNRQSTRKFLALNQIKKFCASPLKKLRNTKFKMTPPNLLPGTGNPSGGSVDVFL